MISIKTFVFNPFEENTYLAIDDEKNCIIIDPGCYDNEEFIKLSRFIDNNNLKVKKIINTHGHIDHIFGVKKTADTYNIIPEIHFLEKNLLDIMDWQAGLFGIKEPEMPNTWNYIYDETEILFGINKIRIIHVPGHSPGSIALYFHDNKILLSGDILFNGSIGRTDFPGGSYETLITGIKEKLLLLPEDTIIYPGHGLTSTIKNETQHNPFLKY